MSVSPNSARTGHPRPAAMALPTLDQLAATAVIPDDANAHAHELPSAIPLSHAHPLLAAHPFDGDAFLLSRAQHSSLPELRSELREYLASLKAELVQLINDDYESFISLSTDLRGEGARLERMRYPLQSVRADIMTSKVELQNVQDEVQLKLAERASARDEKALVHLLLRLSESASRLEALLQIDQDEGSVVPAAMSSDERSSTSKIKHLTRATAEYSQLLYLSHKAQAASCLFVDVLQPRLSHIQRSLKAEIGTFFTATITYKPNSERERSKQAAEIKECLKLYDTLCLYRDAEEVVRKELMSEFIRKTIFPLALTVPASPIVPHTPLPVQPLSASHLSLQPPPTPYTPHPGYPFSDPPATEHFVASTGLDDSPLGLFFTSILRFVGRQFRVLLDTSELLNRARLTEKDGDSDTGFNIFTNVVWDEIGRALLDELGAHLFVIGKPDELQKNHLVTQKFFLALETLAPAAHDVLSMRAHPTYATFRKRWQLPVYFQLRWKEIVGALEEGYAKPLTHLAASGLQLKPDEKGFAALQPLATYRAIQRCWVQDVFISELGWRFWKLTLQIIVRFSGWLEEWVPTIEFRIPTNIMQKENSNRTRSSTPIPRASTPDNAATENAQETISLKQAAVAISDLIHLRHKVYLLWEQQISILLADSYSKVLFLKDALDDSFSSHITLLSSLGMAVKSILTRRACDAVTPLRQLPSQFRAMSSKRQPTRPSEYVSAIMKPVRIFFGLGVAGEAVGAKLADQYSGPWATEIFEAVVARYSALLTTMRKNEESLRRLKKGKKSGFSFFGSSTSSVASSDDNVDEDRVRSQVVLDVDALGKDAASIGVKVEESESFKALTDLAASHYEDGS